jgi:hypothetical protein
MGRVRERPRLMAAQLLAVVVVAGAGVLIGMALAGDETKVPVATQTRLDRAERSASQLESVRADADKARAAAARAGRRSRSLARQNRRLRADLRRVRRALRRR